MRKQVNERDGVHSPQNSLPPPLLPQSLNTPLKENKKPTNFINHKNVKTDKSRTNFLFFYDKVQSSFWAKHGYFPKLHAVSNFQYKRDYPCSIIGSDVWFFLVATIVINMNNQISRIPLLNANSRRKSNSLVTTEQHLRLCLLPLANTLIL